MKNTKVYLQGLEWSQVGDVVVSIEQKMERVTELLCFHFLWFE